MTLGVFAMTVTPRLLRGLFAAAVFLGLTAPAFSQDVKKYAEAINQAQADLDAGRIADAKTKLEATDPNARGFEYHYLVARVAAATGSGPAPDLVRTLPNPKVNARYGVFNEVDRRVVFICQDGALRVYDLKDLEAEPKEVKHAGGAVWSGAFSHDGKTFAAGYENGEVVLWDAATWQPKHTIPLGEKWPVRELAVAPDGSSFVAESKAALELWSASGDKPKKIADVGKRYNFGEGLSFSPKGDLVATGGMFEIDLHDAKTGEKKSSMRHASYTMGLTFSPDGKLIASAPRGNVNKFLAVFDVASGNQHFNAGPYPQYILGQTFSPDSKRVVAVGMDKLVRVYDSTSGEVVLALKRTENGVRPAFSRDARLLAWAEPGGYRYIDLDAKPTGR
jgi:WD40 repeat protein